MAPANTTAFLRSLDCNTVSFFSKYLNTQKYGLSCNLFAPPPWGCFATRIPCWWRKICLQSFCETSLAARREGKDGCIHRLSNRLCFAGIADIWHLTPTTPVKIRHLRYNPLKLWKLWCQCSQSRGVVYLRLRKRTGQLPIPLCLSSKQ